METAGLKIVRADWSNALLICRKCSKKLGGGFGPKQRLSLAKALRQHIGLKKGRKAGMGIVEVQCLRICPKNAVTVIDGADPHSWKIVPAGADLDAVAAGLGLGGQYSGPVQLKVM